MPRLKKLHVVVFFVSSVFVITLLLHGQDRRKDILRFSNQADEASSLEQSNDTFGGSAETPITEIGGEDLKTLFKMRNRKIQDVCLDESSVELKINSSNSNSKEFLINSEYKLVWCNIFKSASTTWFHNFLKLKGYTEKDFKKAKKTPVEFTRKNAYPRPSVEQVTETMKSENYTSFIIVRHPFEQLLSSYRDKIATNSEHFYDSVRCEMSGTPLLRQRQKCKPTFPQFVNFVIRQADAGEHLDEHWQRYDTFCSPCQYNFSYVLHFENLPEEEKFLLTQVSGLSTVLQPQIRHASNSDYQQLLPQFYSQLSKDQLADLIRIYRKDFLLFGYSWQTYLELVS